MYCTPVAFQQPFFSLALCRRGNVTHPMLPPLQMWIFRTKSDLTITPCANDKFAPNILGGLAIFASYYNRVPLTFVVVHLLRMDHYLPQCHYLNCKTYWLVTKIGNQPKLGKISLEEGRFIDIIKKIKNILEGFLESVVIEYFVIWLVSCCKSILIENGAVWY
jgi:hypothetical protein